MEKKELHHIVKLEGGKLICSCQESMFEGLPCRHELSIYVKTTQSIKVLNINHRWTKEFFNVSVLSPASLEEKPQNGEDQQLDANTIEKNTIRVIMNLLFS